MEVMLKVGEAAYTIDHVTTNLVKDRLNQRNPYHKHPVYHYIYILEGKGIVTVGTESTVATPGLLYVIYPNEPHCFLFGDGVALTNFECTFRLLDSRGEPATAPLLPTPTEGWSVSAPPAVRAPLLTPDAVQPNVPGPPQGLRPFIVPNRYRPFLIEAFDRVVEAFDRSVYQYAPNVGLNVVDLLARVESIVNSMLTAESARTDGASDIVINAKRYLSAHCGRSVTLRETAEAVHVSPNYLCRVFKERTGLTPMGYLQATRMREAEKLLALTDLPVYTIAERLGYEEPSYFARVFRGATGDSPQSFRRRLQQEGERQEGAQREGG